MHEATLIDEPRAVRLVNLRHSWQVKVLGVKTNDAVFIDWLPLAAIDNTITEGIEPLLSYIIPAHLGYTQSLLSLFVHEGFQQLIFLLLLEETEVSLTLYLVFETVEFGDIHLTKFNGLADATLILQLENTSRRLVIGNQKQWSDDEVCPVTLPSLLVEVVVMTATTVETITLQLIILQHGLTVLLLLEPPCCIGKGSLPDGSFLELAL